MVVHDQRHFRLTRVILHHFDLDPINPSIFCNFYVNWRKMCQCPPTLFGVTNCIPTNVWQCVLLGSAKPKHLTMLHVAYFQTCCGQTTSYWIWGLIIVSYVSWLAPWPSPAISDSSNLAKLKWFVLSIVMNITVTHAHTQRRSADAGSRRQPWKQIVSLPVGSRKVM